MALSPSSTFWVSQRVRDEGVRDLNEYVGLVLEDAYSFVGQLRVIMFSDSIVAFTADDSDESFEAITSFASQLLYRLILAKIPVRGAISHGEIVRSNDRDAGVVIAGPPVIEAHHYECQQQWIGVMLAPSIHKRFANLPERCDLSTLRQKHPQDSLSLLVAVHKSAKVQPYADIPLEPTKGTITPYDGYAVVPMAPQKRLEFSVLTLSSRSRDALRACTLSNGALQTLGRRRNTNEPSSGCTGGSGVASRVSSYPTQLR